MLRIIKQLLYIDYSIVGRKYQLFVYIDYTQLTFRRFKFKIYIYGIYGGLIMSKKKKKPLMAMISSAYFKIYTKHFLTFRRGAASMTTNAEPLISRKA